MELKDYKQVLWTIKRICKNTDDCGTCVIRNICGGYPNKDWDIDMAAKNICKWAKERPQKTRLQDFLEKYPNAPVNSKGLPKACAVPLGYTDVCSGFCADCWDTSLYE